MASGGGIQPRQLLARSLSFDLTLLEESDGLLVKLLLGAGVLTTLEILVLVRGFLHYREATRCRSPLGYRSATSRQGSGNTRAPKAVESSHPHLSLRYTRCGRRPSSFLLARDPGLLGQRPAIDAASGKNRSDALTSSGSDKVELSRRRASLSRSLVRLHLRGQ